MREKCRKRKNSCWK